MQIGPKCFVNINKNKLLRTFIDNLIEMCLSCLYISDIKVILNDEWTSVNNKIIRTILTLLDHIVDS